ncbi:MAG: zinc-binding dehydrogenase [Halobacteriales archaeon]
MEAVVFTEHGDRDVVDHVELPEPEPGDGEVVVEVEAAALNHLDVWTRRGLPGLGLEMPHVPGSDAAGVVVETGEDVERWREGDRVAVWPGVSCGECEFCRDGDTALCVDYHIIGEHTEGVQAERVALPADNLVEVPEDVPWTTAAAAPLVFGTAWRMLVERADVEAGERVLVLGASGGVGHAAVQIADHAGAEVYATAGSQEKRRAAEDLGAVEAFDYADGFASAVRDATGGRGVDVVVDHVGEESWGDSLKSLAKGGRVVTCGATTGPNPPAELNRVFWNQLSVIGSTMATPGEADDVLSLVWKGDLEPRVRDVLPFSEAADGHRMLEEREGFGKVVLRPDSKT